ncbi:hypothetical protein Anapl_19061 [Anas platyrhynchos]|uniref:Uncharacterized protein n=1 Tax=Anas platyrhynchos TaxID=8839 RepID=R0KTW7_ANAPL|nr:hypothetical protein Anapl_19061 [Anas platyrhynchos]
MDDDLEALISAFVPCETGCQKAKRAGRYPRCLLRSFAPTPSQKASHFSGNEVEVEGSQKARVPSPSCGGPEWNAKKPPERQLLLSSLETTFLEAGSTGISSEGPFPWYLGVLYPKAIHCWLPAPKSFTASSIQHCNSIDDTSFPRKSVHCELCVLPGASATTRPVAAGVPEDLGCFLEKRQAGGSARCVADEIPRHAGDGNITLTSMDSPQWTIKFIW